MSDSPNIDPDLSTETPDDSKQHEAPDVDVTSTGDVDPLDGTDEDDVPVDNPAG